MEHRHLGRSGLKVSEIAYGNWITHGSQVAEDAALACVAAALDEGITTFDTADVYGPHTNEELLGRFLRGRRAAVFIATKFGFVSDPDKPAAPNTIDGRPARVAQACEDSLRRLNVERKIGRALCRERV